MWCPKCKNEYVPGITQCADCGVSLVESLDDFSSRESTAEPIEVGIYEEDCVCENDVPTSEDAPVKRTHAYISQKSKTEDMKSTAYTFTLVGILGIVALVLFVTGVLPLHTANYMKIMICIVMGAMFLIFLVIGIRSFQQINAYSTAADKEENLLTEVTTWFLNSYHKVDIDSDIDTTQQEELLYFSRYEVMRQYIVAQYPDIDESVLDHLIETIYAEIF